MRILFQGDSITDGGRDKSDLSDLGRGYAALAAKRLLSEFPDRQLEFINRGVGGDRAYNLKRRWQEDCIDLKPDLVSILIGINDIWKPADLPWVDYDYEEDYRFILEKVKRETKAKIIILEPFLLHVLPDRDQWRKNFNLKIDAARKLAREYADAFIPLDGYFARASVQEDPAYWAEDGVHPTGAGVELIADHYVETLKKVLFGEV